MDLQPTALSIMYAQLELQLGLLRATTPKYSNYSYETVSWHLMQNDTAPAAMAIKMVARKAAKLWHVDVDTASNCPGLVRADIVRKLNSWNENGVVVLKVGGVQHVYRLLR